MLGKILGLASLGSAISTVGLTRKFVSDLILIIMLAMVAAMIAGALIICGLFECDILLVRHGLETDIAALVTALIGMLILAIIVGSIAYKIRRLRDFPLRLSGVGLNMATIQSIIRGFTKGLRD